MNEDVDDIQLVGKCGDGIVSVLLGHQALRVDGLTDEGIEVAVVSLMIEEDRAPVVLYDGAAIGKGRMSVAHFGVFVELVARLK